MNRHSTAVGALGVLVFLGTGAYMMSIFPEAYADNEVIRFQYRATHIYLLLASLLNLMVVSPEPLCKRDHWIQRLGAVTLMTTPALFCSAFFLEPPRAGTEHWLTFFGVLGCLVGTGLLKYVAIRLR